jgi:hypothetical protein
MYFYSIWQNDERGFWGWGNERGEIDLTLKHHFCAKTSPDLVKDNKHTEMTATQ